MTTSAAVGDQGRVGRVRELDSQLARSPSWCVGAKLTPRLDADVAASANDGLAGAEFGSVARFVGTRIVTGGRRSRFAVAVQGVAARALLLNASASMSCVAETIIGGQGARLSVQRSRRL
ncbi:MAG: hypothetical protein V2A73_22050 [Pseudomonadota bacterium]